MNKTAKVWGSTQWKQWLIQLAPAAQRRSLGLNRTSSSFMWFCLCAKTIDSGYDLAHAFMLGCKQKPLFARNRTLNVAFVLRVIYLSLLAKCNVSYFLARRSALRFGLPSLPSSWFGFDLLLMKWSKWAEQVFKRERKLNCWVYICTNGETHSFSYFQRVLL